MWQGALFVVGALLFAGAVEAAVGSRLVYGRAPGITLCPDESELRAAVRARLGYDPFFPWADQTIVVHLASRPNRRLSGKVYLVDSQGRASPEREFTTTADECSELVLALALAIVITLDPLHGSTASQASVSSAAPPSPAMSATPANGHGGEGRVANGTTGSGEIAASPPSGASNANNRPTASNSNSGAISAVAPGIGVGSDSGLGARQSAVASAVVKLEAGGGAIAAAGTMPGISAGFIPFVRARHGVGSVAVEGRYEFSALNWVNGDRVSVSLLGGSVVPCFHLGLVAGCASFLLGRYHAEGLDVAPKEAAALFAAAGLRVGAEIAVGSSTWAFIRGEGLVNLTRHELTTSEEPLWRVPVLGFTLSAGAFASIL
jgi:hypothetical protein